MKNSNLIKIMLLCTFNMLYTQTIKTVELPSKLTENSVVSVIHKMKNGELNNFEVIRKISERKADAIPILTKLLSYHDEEKSENSNDSLLEIVTVKLYAVYCLEVIGGQSAIDVLTISFPLQNNPEIQGAILNVFARSFYEQISGSNNQLAPPKEIIHLLLKNADNDAMVQRFDKSVGQIAREGLQRWMGIVFDAIAPGQTVKVKESNAKVEMTAKQYREWLWKKYSNRLTWNKTTNLFQITK